ncbi:hypothetical protein B484DRAFT_444467 [Ochromonadaceae sp. CCMP2298]|nr:hypothetical protein B484DRAFT_444467 [Ochromonadaceae sp. CCMP2298]
MLSAAYVRFCDAPCICFCIHSPYIYLCAFLFCFGVLVDSPVFSHHAPYMSHIPHPPMTIHSFSVICTFEATSGVSYITSILASLATSHSCVLMYCNHATKASLLVCSMPAAVHTSRLSARVHREENCSAIATMGCSSYPSPSPMWL